MVALDNIIYDSTKATGNIITSIKAQNAIGASILRKLAYDTVVADTLVLLDRKKGGKIPTEKSNRIAEAVAKMYVYNGMERTDLIYEDNLIFLISIAYSDMEDAMKKIA